MYGAEIEALFTEKQNVIVELEEDEISSDSNSSVSGDPTNEPVCLPLDNNNINSMSATITE